MGASASKIREGGDKRGRRRVVTASLILGDLLAIVAGFCAASLFRTAIVEPTPVSSILLAVIPIYFGWALNISALNAQVGLSVWTSWRKATSAFVAAFVSVLLIAFIFKATSEFSRIVLSVGAVLALLLIWLLRWAIGRSAVKYLGPTPYANLCIYDGVPLTRNSGEFAIDARTFDLQPDPSDLSAMRRLAQVAERMDRVVIHCTAERRASWAFALKSLDRPSEIVLPELNPLAPLAIDYRTGDVSLVLSSGQLGWNQQILKRAFDLVVTVPAIAVLSIPMMIVAMAIALESRGPILFRQDRLGLGNRPFKIWKFRSMHANRADSEGRRSASRDDDRVTRVGAFIRRTSVDELPQLFNVLRGDMSIVGPRPHATGSRAEDMLFWDIDHRYWHRHAVKPGLTGLAQIRGYRGATEAKSDLSNRLQSDLEYVANWSLMGDIRIMIQTFDVLLHRNAF